MAKVHWEQKKDGWYWDTPDGGKGGPLDTRKQAQAAGYDHLVALEAPPKKVVKPVDKGGDDE